MMIVGGDRGDLRVRHRNPRVERGELQMLLVLLWAIVAARQREDQWIVALQLAELARGARVIGQFVVGENASGNDIRTHVGFLSFLSELLLKIFSQRSKVTPAFGWEQHMSTFPEAGFSSGSGL